MEQTLKLLLKEIDRCYLLAGQELLERERLDSMRKKIRTELALLVNDLEDEILCLKFKKINSGWRTELKPGFHNISTAHSELEVWRILIEEIVDHLKKSTKTFKNRLEAEGLFIESRSKEGDDLHIIIGERDGKPNKAHVVVDEKTAEIRVEGNQVEPLELVEKIESIITLSSGKKIRATRESLEEILDNDVLFNIQDVSCGVNSMLKEGVADTFMVKITFVLKNFSGEKIHVRNINFELLVPDGYSNPNRFDLSTSKSEIDIGGRDVYVGHVQFSTSIKGWHIGIVPGEEWDENKQKILSSTSSAKFFLNFSSDYVSVSREGKILKSEDLTDKLKTQIFKMKG